MDVAYSPRKLHPADVDRPEQLVPIRLEFDVEQHHKMRDTFVWNLNGTLMPSRYYFSVCLLKIYNRSGRHS